MCGLTKEAEQLWEYVSNHWQDFILLIVKTKTMVV
uniref:Uncharacterized protein n=1 Tax=Brassica oleracea TaxID=3712 RepID=A0A3P6GQI6_BRAOL|nr:unnamed protein product [Brassica oleracea]